MLTHIKPEKKGSKSKAASPTPEERSLAKRLMIMGYKLQDITFIINQGREKIINHGRISEVGKDDTIAPSSEEDAINYLKIQSSYDAKTLLNPYKNTRLIRAREAMIAAVHIFNSPTIIFRSEIFSVLANIAWTYLLHEKLEKTKKDSSKLKNGDSVTLKGTLQKDICPIKDKAVIENLNIVSDIRNDVEHNFFVGGDYFGPIFQSCCINFNKYMTEWFGSNLSLENELSLALQFVRLDKKQVIELEKSSFPPRIRTIADNVESSEFVNNPYFQMNVHYVTKVSSKTGADVYHLIDYSGESDAILMAIKKVDYRRLSQNEVVEEVKQRCYSKFSAWEHQKFWMGMWGTAKERNEKAGGQYGEKILKNQWVWFEQVWLPEVLKYCEKSENKFK